MSENPKRLCYALAAVLLAASLHAQPPEDLPRVLIIGDSISIGYTPRVVELLSGKALVQHNPGNAQDTAAGLAKLDEWLADGDWDVIHFNWGLWDMRFDNGFERGPRVPLARYQENLTTLVARLKKTGAALVWAATTPVPANAARRIESAEKAYNDVARRIMTDNAIAVNDLHALVLPKLKEYQQNANVHFHPAGSRAMARQVADAILRQLPWPRHTIDESSRGADGVRLADVNGDGRPDIATGWEEGGLTRAYINPGPEKAKDPWPAVTVGPTPSVEDAVFADLDGDGATDVISCCEGATQTVFIHWAPPDRTRYLNPQAWTTWAIPDRANKTRWMFCVPLQLDNRNGLDLILGSRHPNGQIGFYRLGPDPRSPDAYEYHRLSDAGWIMSLVAIDMDHDGDPDILTSDRRDALRGVRWLENPGPDHVAARQWTNHFIGARDWEVLFLRNADLDNDGLEDIVAAVRQDGRTRQFLCYYRKDGAGLNWDERMILFPPNTGNAKGVAVGDLDHDGKPDIVFSCEGANGDKSGVMWLRQEPDGTWTPGEISGPPGVKFDRIELLDLDNDGDLDVLTCEEQDTNSRGQKGGLGVFWYENPLDRWQQ